MAGMKSAAALETEEDKLARPCFQAYLKGAWWEVEILERRPLPAGAEKLLIRYLELKDEEDEWVSLDVLRLRARRADDWDCSILKRGVDVSVFDVHHPQAEQFRSPTAMVFYDARIVKVSKSKHVLDCCCKFFIQFYVMKDGTSFVHGVHRALVKHNPAMEVDISKLSVLQRPGVIPLHEILKAHISTKAENRRWSNDAYFLKETELKILRKGEEESTTTPRGAYLPDVSEESLANLGVRLRIVNGVSKTQKCPDVETTTRHGSGWADAAQKTNKREGNEVDHRGIKSPKKNNLKYPDRGYKRKHESLEEKEISDIEDYSPGVSSRFARSKDMAPGGSRRPDENVGERVTGSCHQSLHKTREPVDFKRGRKLKMTDSESSPDQTFPDSSPDLIGESDRNSDRGSTREVFLKRGRREEEQPWKSHRLHGRRSSRYEHHNAAEQVLKNTGYGNSKQGQSPGMKWNVEDRDRERYYNTQKADKRNLDGKDSKSDKKPEEKTSGRRRGRPRGHTVKDGKGYEWREEISPRDMNDDLGGPECSKEPGLERSGKPKTHFESPNSVTAFGDSQEIETSREISRRETGKFPEGIVTKRSSERLQKVSPAKPITKKEHEKGGNDPALAKTDVYLSSSSPNSEDPASGLGSQQLRKVGPRVPLKAKKSLLISSKSNKMRRDAEKENRAKDRPPPLYMDLLVNNSKEDDDSEMQCPPSEKKPDCGLNDTWDPMVEDVLSDDPDCNIVSEKGSLPKTLWQEFDEPTAAVDTEQALPLTSQEAAQPEVYESDSDIEGIKCEHKNQLFKGDVGNVCINCGIITERIEDVVPQVEMPKRRPREADLDEWDIDRYSPDGNQGAVGYDHIKNDEVVRMLNTSLPAHYAQQMHPHQKDGFEFLWRNLGYDAEGNLRTKKADRNAGCILSHAPGTGKSFLIISFLKSYLDRFPTSRPLIVAPKIMLLRWQKEFVRWKSDIKVFILNTALTSGKRLLQKHEEAGVVSLKSHQMNFKAQVNNLRMAVLYEWKRERSVCLVSYNMFSSLTDEEGSNKTQEGKTLRKCLLEHPGILILDEGHFPRNKDTRIRNALMKVKTNARILLSGTLFQNNFEELFNSLYLIRPGFVHLCLSVLSRKESGEDLANDHPDMKEVTEADERKARKLFVEEIGLKIEEGQRRGKGSEVLQHEANTALQMLQRLTKNFVHHHTGEVLACLPGLRDFGMLLKPAPLQSCLLEVVDKSFSKAEEYLKREIAVSHSSIHPKLVTKLDFVTRDNINLPEAGFRSELSAMLREPSHPQDGIKTKFVFDLLGSLKYTSEKVLIFSQHMAPLEMLEDMFKQTFNWDKNKDVLRLDGKMHLNDRETVIERFNDSSSQVQVLLASTKACGEGINLVGASRVVFLDVLWNPAVIKQAISRAFRLGQKKIVYVYRLVAIGTIEEKKYKKAIQKDWLSKSIFTQTAGEADGETDDVLVDPSEAWEVDASTCEDDLLEKLLKKDKNEGNSFTKVVEHGSQFSNRKTTHGPDAREWFLEDLVYKDLSHTKGTREGEGPGVGKVLARGGESTSYEDYGEIGTFDADAASSSDADEEIL